MYYGQSEGGRSTKTVQSEKAVVESRSKNSSNSSSTTTTRNTEPGVSLSDEQIERVAMAYSAAISKDIPPMAARMMEQAMQDGMTAECLIIAINDTGWALKPTPQYLRAILRRCRDQGIRTAEEYRQAQSAYARQQTPVRSAWKVNRFDYQQHTYTEADFGADFFYDPARDNSMQI